MMMMMMMVVVVFVVGNKENETSALFGFLWFLNLSDPLEEVF